MINIIGKIPPQVTLACSGGIDSMTILHFLLNGNRKVKLAYFNHDTIHSKEAEQFVTSIANEKKVKLAIGRVKGKKGKKSLEEFWRDERYSFFDSLGDDYIITCHHLDDVMETWLMSSFVGNPKLIPHRRGENIFRPFLLTSKKSIKDYAKRKLVTWVEDPSNLQTNMTRNYVRHNIMNHVLRVNPGFRKVIRKKIINSYKGP